MSTFSESNVVREKAGQPTGGQFAEKQRPASGISLSCPQAHSSQVDADARALDDITRLLGTSPEWSSPGDYLTDIANLAADSGRPHPGFYSDTDEFERDWQEYLAGRESTGTPDEKALDTIVHGLGTEEHWGATDLEWIAGAVADSGRPHPGEPWTAGELERDMRAAALESGRRDPDELDRVTDLSKEQGAETALAYIEGRLGSVPMERLAQLGAEDIATLQRHVNAAADEMADWMRREYSLGYPMSQREAREHIEDVVDQAEMPQLAGPLQEMNSRHPMRLSMVSGADLETMAEELPAVRDLDAAFDAATAGSQGA